MLLDLSPASASSRKEVIFLLWWLKDQQEILLYLDVSSSNETASSSQRNRYTSKMHGTWYSRLCYVFHSLTLVVLSTLTSIWCKCRDESKENFLTHLLHENFCVTRSSMTAFVVKWKDWTHLDWQWQWSLLRGAVTDEMSWDRVSEECSRVAWLMLQRQTGGWHWQSRMLLPVDTQSSRPAYKDTLALLRTGTERIWTPREKWAVERMRGQEREREREKERRTGHFHQEIVYSTSPREDD